MEPYERLSEAMRRRRLELGMKTWRELSTLADISYETLRAVRSGSNPSEGTADGLERALKWEPGSIRHVLSGGHPAPVVQGAARRVSDGSPPAAPEQSTALDRLQELVETDPAAARAIAELVEIIRRGSRPGEPERADERRRDIG